MTIGDTILEMLKEEISEVEYNRYVKQMSFLSKASRSDLAVFEVPNPLLASWIKNHYASKIAHLFEIKTGSTREVNIRVKKAKGLAGKSGPSAAVTPAEGPKHSMLNPAYTFENFVAGSSNQFAYAAAKSVSERPGQVYNPLFIYGGVGLGKTHLMQAIGNVMLLQGKTVVYTSVEQFVNDFTRHLRNQTMDRFKEKYRQCDLLLIDDVQFLSNKIQTQEEFFHTFETLRSEGKQIVLTSDKPPKRIAGLEARLQSRFEWGLVADIQPPELETKIAIIKKKCEINRVILGDDVVNYIATVIDNNTREIEGILSKLHAYSQLMHQEITLDFAKNALREQLQEKSDNISIDGIMKTIAKELNVKPSEIRSKSRSRNIVAARRVAIYLARELTPMSMPQIAQYFGMKDHSTVSHTMKKIHQLLEEDENFKVKINELHNKITAMPPETV
ncbi:chromosomal replication initiator protein DnaA [Sulfurimonas sp. HSL-3221]|uniref:chromosomal replication initiator protein DnaA n=1 Tax=Thiomicrolovo sulfuroxydans TaxID=2894755 RepID=UPI001E3268FC|nr:chromosomal replication initiator protein DnaA [Sulfurimonas sp. HSL-3221]UFS62531.1 chromosomal replication initiator protein DnaA [Sulfurimonas sp. HSL-3221]